MQFRSDGTSKQQFARCAVSPHIKNDDYLVRSIPKHRLVVDAVFVRRSGADNRLFLEHIPEIRQMFFAGCRQCLRTTASSCLRPSFSLPVSLHRISKIQMVCSQSVVANQVPKLM